MNRTKEGVLRPGPWIVAPYPPSVNNLYFDAVRKGRVFRILTTEGKKYKSDVATLGRAAGYKKPLPEYVPVIFRVEIYRPRKIGDLSNCLKVLEDALSGVCYIDDKQIVEIHARRFDDKKNPRAEVRIEVKGEENALFPKY